MEAGGCKGAPVKVVVFEAVLLEAAFVKVVLFEAAVLKGASAKLLSLKLPV